MRGVSLLPELFLSSDTRIYSCETIASFKGVPDGKYMINVTISTDCSEKIGPVGTGYIRLHFIVSQN